jgi:hypothetical protein
VVDLQGTRHDYWSNSANSQRSAERIKAARGKYRATLNDLSPEYLKEIPLPK